MESRTKFFQRLGRSRMLPVAVLPVAAILRQPVAGTVVALADVPDAMFAQGTMGPGLAIDPAGDTVVALDDGTELLIHIGIDTVGMEGDGFETLVKTGDHVEAGTPLIRFDPAKIRAAGLSPITPVIVLNDEDATVAFS
ncbi:PTS glucose transporter subunit IIA [Microbacterium lacticum]